MYGRQLLQSKLGGIQLVEVGIIIRSEGSCKVVPNTVTEEHNILVIIKIAGFRIEQERDKVTCICFVGVSDKVSEHFHQVR